MEWLTNLRLRWSALWRRRQLDQDLDDELQFHLAMREASGGDARKRFGNTTAIKEATRDMWTFPRLESIWADIRYGARVLSKSPLFTTAAVLSLALGIGANTAIFTVIDAVLLKKLPVRAPDELVIATWTNRGGLPVSNWGGRSGTDPETGLAFGNVFHYQAYESFRERATKLSDVFAFNKLYRAAVNLDGHTELASGMLVSGNFYRALGVHPLLGRLLNEADDRAGAEPVAVISYQLWRDKLGGDPRAVGRSTVLNGVPITIVGVTPPDFYGVSPGGFLPSPDVTLALHQSGRLERRTMHSDEDRLTDSGIWWLNVMGRLKPGTSVEAAEAELSAILGQALREANIEIPADGTVPAITLASGTRGLDTVREKSAVPLELLLAAAGLVLLIACANVATLMLARAMARASEITVRLAMGAGRRRLIRQLLTEGLLLSTTAGAIGVLLAWWGSRILVSWAVEMNGPLRAPAGLDARVLGFTACLSMITALLFSLAPALRASRVNLAPTLNERTAGGGSRRDHSGRLGQGLVALQVALSLVLIVGAGLFVRTLRNLRAVDLGFRTEGLLLFGIDPSLSQYEDARMANLYRSLLARLEAAPGVLSATAASQRLITGWVTNGPARIPGAPGLANGTIPSHFNFVGPRFFETMGIPLLLGRGPDERDTANSRRVAFVNEAVAKAAFADSSPLGATVFLWGPNEGYEIVGVVADAHYARVTQDPPPTVYVPYEQSPYGISKSLDFAVRTAGPPEAFVSTARALVAELDPNLPLIDVDTQRDVIEHQFAQQRLFANLSTAFGALAVVLACIGIYGVVSYSVARRTSEVGIRMALGARQGGIIWMMLRRVAMLAVLGVAAGIGGALALTRLVKSMLWQVTPDDPATFAGAAVLLLLVALAAGFIPARRAARIHPMQALRSE